MLLLGVIRRSGIFLASLLASAVLVFGLMDLLTGDPTRIAVALDGADRPPRPLKTIRLLVSPSAAERAANRLIDEGAAVPTWVGIRDALKAWRQDIAQGKDEIALFYFGGHGIRRAL